jgi:hypothetical protein
MPTSPFFFFSPECGYAGRGRERKGGEKGAKLIVVSGFGVCVFFFFNRNPNTKQPKSTRSKPQTTTHNGTV